MIIMNMENNKNMMMKKKKFYRKIFLLRKIRKKFRMIIKYKSPKIQIIIIYSQLNIKMKFNLLIVLSVALKQINQKIFIIW